MEIIKKLKQTQLGYLGDISFVVSSIKQLTFKDLKHTKSAKFQEHEIIGKKPLTEYLGQTLDEITLAIELYQSLTVNVETVIKQINDYIADGEALEFVVGNKPFGLDKWTIESCSEAYNLIYRNGAITSVTLDLSLKEYISDVDLQPKNNVAQLSKIKKAINYYSKAKTVARTALAGGYNSFIQVEAMNNLLNTIKG